MSKFTKDSFNFDGMYLTYGTDRKFVGRFKRGGMAHFRSFLVKNFSVEEYFTLTDSGVAPLTALISKGYVSQTVSKLLKTMGYPATQEGVRAYLNKARV